MTHAYRTFNSISHDEAFVNIIFQIFEKNLVWDKYTAWVKKWLGRLDSNQRVEESKSSALPLGYAPIWGKVRHNALHMQRVM